MNIFILDLDIDKCAQMHVNKHVVKMILESAQMLSTAMHMHGMEDIAPYKITHQNHPCTKWVRESKSNFLWLWKLMHALNEEYKFRYNKTINHLSYDKLMATDADIFIEIPDKGLTPFANCTTLKTEKDTVKAYRMYYLQEKAHILDWGIRGEPSWLKDL